MRRGGRNLKGKGGGATKTVKEGENINKQRGRGGNAPSIGALLSRGAAAGKQQAARKDFDSAKCDDVSNLLQPNTSLFQDKLSEIEFLLNDLNTVGAGVIPSWQLHVKSKVLQDVDAFNLDRFSRTLQWLQDFATFGGVNPTDYEEKTYVIPPSQFREGYAANLIRRGERETLLRVEKLYNQKLFLPLPSIQLCPRLAIAMESANFNIDTSAQEGAKTIVKRWRFPIDSNTASRLNIDVGQDVATEDSINFTASRISGLPYVRTDVARGFIDLTTTELPNSSMLYAIDINLDPTTINAIATEKQVSIFAGKEVTTTARDVKFLTLSEAQLQLLDSWTKILATVINRSGVFMTTPERQIIEEGFNRALGLSASVKTIPTDIVNRPVDLTTRDLSWLSPTKSEMFMHLADYDRPEQANLPFLQKQGLFKPVFAVSGGYYVSPKADGTRYYLYFAQTGLYLVNPISRVLTKITGFNTDAPFVRNLLPGTILDTEVIGEIRPQGTLEEYQVLVFDILAMEGVDIRQKTYTDRLIAIQSVTAKLNDVQFVDKVLRSSELEDAKAAGFLRPAIVKSFRNVIKIAAKPVYRLPSLEDIPATNTDGSQITETDKRLMARQLANNFFKTIGAVARTSYYSTASLDQVLIEGVLRKPIAQNTNGIIWYTDGIILTPAERPYMEVDPIKGFKFSMVKKWKPVITIDFRVKRDATGRLTLFSAVNQGQGEVAFTGDRYPWNGQAELSEAMEGKIIEFEWTGEGFVMFKERQDKISPNKVGVATSLWNLINDPITLEDLEGKTMMLMAKYHNRVKTYALADLAKGISSTTKTLLDLGSGRGGDIQKWTRFKRVYAVEPDVENLRELISRQQGRQDFDYATVAKSAISQNKINHYGRAAGLHSRSRLVDDQLQSLANIGGQSKVQAAGSISTGVLKGASKRILKTQLQETQESTYSRAQKIQDQQSRIVTINLPAQDVEGLLSKVPINRVDAVTMFNALTFFYQDLTKLTSMIETVKTFLRVGGHFYVLAMDGELLLSAMGDHNTITTGSIEISKSPDVSCRKIWIKSKVGIVRGQYEYLIHLREFVQVMASHGFKLLDERYLDEELLLTDEEYWFSSLFKLMKFTYGSVKLSESNLVENLKPLIERMENVNVIQPLEPYEAPQFIRSTVLTARGVTGLLRYGNPQDGSAYIHAVLRAFSKPYNALNLAEKQGFIIQLRKELSDKYTREIHDQIDGGMLARSTVPAFQFENLKAALGDAAFWISQHLMEFINQQLQVNVTVLRGIDAQPYQFPDVQFKVKPGYKNIVLYWINDNHYETVGQLKANNFVQLVFEQPL